MSSLQAIPPKNKISRKLRKELEREYVSRETMLREYLRRRARAGDCNALVMLCGKSATTGLPIVQGDIHILGHRHIDANKNSLVILPREHGKSTNFVVFRNAHEIGQAVIKGHPEIRVNIVCATGDNADLRAAAVREIMETPEYQWVYPEVKIVSGPGRTGWTIARKAGIIDPTMTSSGVLSSVTSKRSDFISFDDIVDLRNAITTPALRKAIKEAFYGTWMNLLSENGRSLYAATPWHKADLTMELMKNPAYALFYRPVVEVGAGKYIPVWPEQWPVSRLLSKRAEVGTRSFARGYLCIPISDEDLFIKPQWIRYWFDGQLPTREKDPRAFQIITVDPAISKRDTANFAVAMRGIVSNGNAYVIEFDRAHMSFPEQKASIRRLAVNARKGPPLRAVGIESVAYQAALAQELRLDRDIGGKIVEIHRTADKFVRVNELALACENGKVYLKGDLATGLVHRDQADLYEEMTGFPVAPNDDLVDALRDMVVEFAAYPDVPWSALKGLGMDVQPDGR